MLYRWIFVIGAVLFFVMWAILLPSRLSGPISETFTHDPGDYSAAAIHLVKEHFYSLDGVTPALEREPGYSFFLAVIYFVFGVENRFAIFAMQGLLYLFASFFFVRSLDRRVTDRLIAPVCFILLLLLPSVYHMIFSAYRESFALTLLLLISGVFLDFLHQPSWRSSCMLGCLLAYFSLTVVSFIFLPFFLLGLGYFLRCRLKFFLAPLFIPLVILSLWGLRNAHTTGHWQLTGGVRSSAMWYVRGERSEHLRGIEPFRCLWSEYISRDWTGRSRQCSYIGILNTRWPAGSTFGDPRVIAWGGQKKIVLYFPFYLWDSIFEVLELHLPYVNGWGFLYNALAALSMVVLYVGSLFSIRSIWRREYAFFLLLILYSTLSYSLTDATPRYLLPTIFCYAVLAAAGFTSMIRRIVR